MNKIKSGDEIIVLCGRDKGRTGVVRKVLLDSQDKPEKVIVEGINTVTHYDRPNPQENQPGGLVKREAPLHASNVAFLNEDKGVRIKIGIGADGKKTRFAAGKEVK
ncbi:50S ribosomal protein L24 [Candidatus Persebacteraceae bacterium Df01]|jgi:large subunit ribosomal protein L24|uniref:Large ribosomal subunit protein uL24 n=1 Tax=Candidatus Doriopsillibacter californiensis TaxID=2970740 RepID=A0ABT7QL35_9GAMM|nr:50S ribosomal protein L24 [Candidatus Persebacteraceae bacterium Df01]